MDKVTKNMTFDEICEEFELYKIRCQQRAEANKQLRKELNMVNEINEMWANIRLLSKHIELRGPKRKLSHFADVNAIVSFPICVNEERYYEANQLTKNASQEKHQEKIGVSCGYAPCMFDYCRRRVNTHLMLLHYHWDHSDENAVTKNCCKLNDGGSVVLCFETRHCQLKQNHVLGFIAYSGSLISSPRTEIYNSLLLKMHSHMESDVPIVVLICKTTAQSPIKEKTPSRWAPKAESDGSQVFVIWLVTPIDHPELNASLKLCGRDEATKSNRTMSVRRQVRESQDTSQFISLDANYWRITFNEMKIISNDFRDELHLEITLTQLRDSC